jgi:rhamnose transport system ATP-binding protein
MVGRDMSEFFARTEHPPGEVLLRVAGLGRTGSFADVSFEVRRGEVLGFAGLVGAGRTDVGLALFGIAPADAGTVELDGAPVAIRSPRDALDRGIAYLSEDRRQLGLSLPQSITANITLPSLRTYARRLGLVDRTAERDAAARLRDRLGIRARHLDQPVGQLSGGNQQKTMLAKWLDTDPAVLILDEPTRGIDVGSKADVHRFVDELARSGMAVILISSDLPEVLAMSDRVLVMREGRQVGTFARAEADEHRIMTAAVGAA